MNAPADTAAAAMDRMYRFQRHFYDASRKYYLLGRDELLDRLQPPRGGSVLEIGCGTGRNLAGAARRYPEARLFGIDISKEMLKSAAGTVMRAHAAARTRLACADATGFDAAQVLRQGHFDRVFFSYTLSMIPDWQAALRHAASLVAENGELHIADFGQCEALPAIFRQGLFYWLSRFVVTPRQELRATLTDLAHETHSTLRFETRHRGYACLASLKR